MGVVVTVVMLLGLMTLAGGLHVIPNSSRKWLDIIIIIGSLVVFGSWNVFWYGFQYWPVFWAKAAVVSGAVMMRL